MPTDSRTQTGKKRGLYSERIASVHPKLVSRRGILRHAEATTPSNEQIVDAASQAYDQFQPLVDLITTNGKNFVLSPGGRPHVATLNGYNWKAPNVGSAHSITQPVLDSSDISPAVDSAKSQDFGSFMIGVSSEAQFIIGAEGGIGVAFPLGPGSSIAGTGWAAGRLGLDISVAVNLDLAIFTDNPPDLGGLFYGLAVDVDVEVSVTLAILLSSSLESLGFSIGVGVGLGGGVTILAGYTDVWTNADVHSPIKAVTAA